jgi:hypothetical protein
LKNDHLGCSEFSAASVEGGAAIGATATYNSLAGMTPASTQNRYYHEFEAKNRLEGDVVFLSLTMPVWMPTAPSASV